MALKHLKDDNFSTEISKGIILVDFYADWCGPCRALAPILEQVSGEVGGKAVIAKVNIDSEQKTAAQYQITSVPTMILFKDGKEMKRLVGMKDAAGIKQFIESV